MDLERIRLMHHMKRIQKTLVLQRCFNIYRIKCQKRRTKLIFLMVRQKKVKGLVLSIIYVYVIAVARLQIKLLAVSSPYVSINDFAIFMGVFTIIASVLLGFITDTLTDVLKYSGVVLCLIIGRTICGVVNNLLVCYAINQLPLSKAIFMINLCPISCAIMAAIFLKEKLTRSYILCLCVAPIGIYLISLNMDDQGKTGSLTGYLSAFCSIWLGGLVFIFVRALNLYGVHASWVYMSCGIGLFFQPVIWNLLKDDVLHFEQYTSYDSFMVITHGMLATLFMLLLYYASKYVEASFIAPISNLENIFSIIVDIFIFHYSFTIIEIAGMSILGACIITIVIIKMQK
ncbi:unnamed protein product [Moneuplotes crassus]|uniref:EamA domain-containing protein n=1 Tax=Euplotes crassus TaxID=5936 RepID=A0AAD2CY92_EUPCR|nr:unnamed protein product [Moneuplotes crassus]